MKLLPLAYVVLFTGCNPISDTPPASSAKTGSKMPVVQQPKVYPVTSRQQTPRTLFTTIGGETVTLQQFAGQVVVLHLWATWCKPCVREMPLLDHLAANMHSVKVVPVSVDIRPEQAATFFKQQLFQHLSAYHDLDGNLMRDLGAHALPMSFLMDRQGRIAAVFKGSVDWNSESIRTLLSGI